MRLLIFTVFSMALHGWLMQPTSTEAVEQKLAGKKTALTIGKVRWARPAAAITAQPAEQTNAAQPKQKSPALKQVVTKTAPSKAVSSKTISSKTMPAPARHSPSGNIANAVMGETKREPTEITKNIVSSAVTKTTQEVAKPVEVTVTDESAELAAQTLNQLPTMVQPNYRKVVAPQYPKLAKKKRQQGVVIVKARVGTNGLVETVDVLESSGFELLDQRALQTVAQWEFHPYRRGQHPAVAWVQVPVEFILH